MSEPETTADEMSVAENKVKSETTPEDRLQTRETMLIGLMKPSKALPAQVMHQPHAGCQPLLLCLVNWSSIHA